MFGRPITFLFSDLLDKILIALFHLRIPFNRARELAIKFRIMDVLFPLFADEPAMFGYNAASPNQLINETGSSKCNTASPSLSGFHHRVSEDYSSINTAAHWNKELGNHNMGHQYAYNNDLQHSQCKLITSPVVSHWLCLIFIYTHSFIFL